MARPIGIVGTEEFEFVLAANRADPTAEQVRFRCRVLTGAERHQVQEMLADCVTTSVGDGKSARGGDSAFSYGAAMRVHRHACELALLGWTGLLDAKGKPVEFPGRGPRAAEMLLTDAVQEIGREIVSRSVLPEGVRGN